MRFTKVLALQASRVSQLQVTPVLQKVQILGALVDDHQRPKADPYHAFAEDLYMQRKYMAPLKDASIQRWEHCTDFTVEYAAYSRTWMRPAAVLTVIVVSSYIFFRYHWNQNLIRLGKDPDIVNSQHSYKYGHDTRSGITQMAVRRHTGGNQPNIFNTQRGRFRD